MTYTYREICPPVDDFIRLRRETGLSPRARAAVEKGLPNSLAAVTVFHGADVVGMGRIIGDGGCNFEIVDMAVSPAHQGQGLGREILARLLAWLDVHAPESAYIDLIADVPAFYEKAGFKDVSPSRGMYRIR